MNFYKIFLFVMCVLPTVCMGSVSCYELGGTTYCSGSDSDGNYISTSSYTLGGTTYTTGSIGDDRVNTSSYEMGETTYYNFY